MIDVLRFWLELGIDGFRVDALSALFEDERLRDNPPNPAWVPAMPDRKRQLRSTRATCRKRTRRWPRCATLDAYPDRVQRCCNSGIRKSSVALLGMTGTPTDHEAT